MLGHQLVSADAVLQVEEVLLMDSVTDTGQCSRHEVCWHGLRVPLSPEYFHAAQDVKQTAAERATSLSGCLLTRQLFIHDGPACIRRRIERVGCVGLQRSAESTELSRRRGSE